MSYEHTTYRVKVAPTELAGEREIVKRPVFDDGSAFLLENVLSKEECDFYIRQAENIGFRSCGYDKRIRVTDRIAATSHDLCDVLFKRVLPFIGDPVNVPFSKEDFPRGIPEDVLPGCWKPIGLNECFRICRYRPGGFFLAHHDFGFERSEVERSLKTFMIYLNDDFEGAPTNFYTEAQPHYQAGRAELVLERVRPPAGSVLVFSSRITHDGGKLDAGKKYLMRTELMYAWSRGERTFFTSHGEVVGSDQEDGEGEGDVGGERGE